ncbi:MAG: hypothetical protein NVSMB65_16160 [Chloroflexota bacterium]
MLMDAGPPGDGSRLRPGDALPSERLGLGAAIWGQLLLRLAGSAGVLVLGSYLADLHDWGLHVTSGAVGLVTALSYVTELVFAPLAGALGDRWGRRKPFLMAGPALSAVGVLLIPLAALGSGRPSLTSVLLLAGVARLIEGLGSAAVVPATLGLLAEGTDTRPPRRGRQMSLFELASSSGIALGAALGPLLWHALHLWAFPVLALTYAGTSAVMGFVHEAPRLPPIHPPLLDLRRFGALLTHRELALFLGAWLAVSAIVGVWLTAQLSFVLTAHLHVPGQRFAGLLHGHPGQLSVLLGGYVLWFSLCVVVWAFVLDGLPRLPVLLFTACGAVLASGALLALNHGGAPVAFVPLVLVGVFLEAGFTPAALAYLADASALAAPARGLLMGLYSVIFGLGQLAGNVMGGLVAEAAYFDGLVVLTIGLAATAVAALGLLLALERRPTGWTAAP